MGKLLGQTGGPSEQPDVVVWAQHKLWFNLLQSCYKYVCSANSSCSFVCGSGCESDMEMLLIEINYRNTAHQLILGALVFFFLLDTPGPAAASAPSVEAPPWPLAVL